MKSGDFLYAVLLIHLIITALYALILVPRQRFMGMGKAVFALCMPFAGVLILLISDLAVLFKKNVRYDYSQLLHEDDTEILSQYNQNEDALLVPVADALYSSNATTKRKAVLNILKKDVGLYVPQLKTALGDEDTETSHYAAAALVEMKGKFDKKVENCLYQINAEPETAECSYQLIRVLFEYINMNILDLITEKKYSDILIEHAQSALEKFGSLPFADFLKYAAIVVRTESTLQGEVLMDFLRQYPDDEEPYTMLLDYYYLCNDKKAMDKIMDRLSKADVVLSRKTLELIRFYRNGEEYIEI